MNILQQIQRDILEPNASLFNTLLRAKILAYELKSETLKHWVSQEIDGYKSVENLPDYRTMQTNLFGQWTDGYRLIKGRPVILSEIKQPNVVDALKTYHIRYGIRKIEEFASNQQYKHFLQGDLVALVNMYAMEDGCGYLEIQRAVGPHDFEQILGTIKNRLLDFVLELDANWNIEQRIPPREQMENLISVRIYNNPQGGNMAVFDQQGQSVNYQYNAVGDINFGAVQNRLELVDELIKLKSEFDRAVQYQVIDEEVAIEADSKLKLALAEAKKPEPNKQTLMERINSAKTLIEGVAAAGGLVTALVKAAELVQRLF